MPTPPARAAGVALAAGLGLVAWSTGRKPLHAAGRTWGAELRIDVPKPDLGVPLLRDRGVHPCTVRVSRAIGTPDGWWDIGGLALRLPGAGHPGSPRRPALRDDGHRTRQPPRPAPGATGRRSSADDAAADEGGGPLGRAAPASGRRRAGAAGVRAGHRRRPRRLGRRGPAPAAPGAVRRHDAVRPDRRRARGHHRAGLGRGRARARLPLVAPAQPSARRLDRQLARAPRLGAAHSSGASATRVGSGRVRRARRRGPRAPCRRTRPRGPRTWRPGPPRGRQG